MIFLDQNWWFSLLCTLQKLVLLNRWTLSTVYDAKLTIVGHKARKDIKLAYVNFFFKKT